MPPRTVNADNPEQLLGDAGMADRKRETAMNVVLIGEDFNPFEALSLNPAPTIEQSLQCPKRQSVTHTGQL